MLSSRAAIADVKSLILDVVVVLFDVDGPEPRPRVFAFLLFTFGRLEIREPAADGGNLGFTAELLVRGEAVDEAK